MPEKPGLFSTVISSLTVSPALPLALPAEMVSPSPASAGSVRKATSNSARSNAEIRLYLIENTPFVQTLHLRVRSLRAERSGVWEIDLLLCPILWVLCFDGRCGIYKNWKGNLLLISRRIGTGIAIYKEAIKRCWI